MFSVRDFDSRYGRSINGDGKAYYAYLPAIFIYQDESYSFIDEIEQKYYPEDRSQFKNFRNKQKNGKYVNKTFPGLSILYAPFFFVSMFFAWIFGYAVDGYSAPFQWGIAFSHVFYFFIGLRFLLSFFRQLKIMDKVSYLIFTLILFGTNCWYYLVYDHSVSHIHSFFLACILLWAIQKWLQSKNSIFLGTVGITMSMLVITRPTNAVMLLFLPFLMSLNGITIKELFGNKYIRMKLMIQHILISAAIIFIPFLLWKWQSDLWIVYSYNEEGFNFRNPQILNFLFSYEKGWFLWTPVVFLSLLTGIYFFAKRSFLLVFWFLLPIITIVYILSSWWIWTFGSGFGQRTVIEFLPYILIGLALFIKRNNIIKLFYFLLIPFCLLSIFQGYQIANSILNGGTTTKSEYWDHFLQCKRDAPLVINGNNMKLIFKKEIKINDRINNKQAYSRSLQTPMLDSVHTIVVGATIGGKHGDNAIRLILSSKDGTYYEAIYISDFLYSEPRYMEFAIEVTNNLSKEFIFYVWNGDSDSRAEIEKLTLKAYKSI